MHNISKLYFFIVFLVVEATLGSPFFLVTPPNVRRGSLSMMFYKMPLHLSWGMQDFMFYVKTFMFFRHLPFRLCVNKLTLWFSMDGVWMLLDVAIIDTIGTNLVLQITLSCGVAMIVVVQAKDDFYWSIHSKHIFPSSHKGHWVCALTSR